MKQEKPVLVVLAAGMGSRYGGLKQLEPVDNQGHLIIDYSIYDAKRAGFEQVIFIIRPEMEQAFAETIAQRIAGQMEIAYAYQNIQDIPEDCTLPQGRSKPWGTAHAALAARHLISGPFAIINADDFYGAQAYEKIFHFLTQEAKGENHHGLVGYALENTVTEHGTVSRGICSVSESGLLQSVVECTHIEKGEHCPRFTKDKGESWTDLSGDTIVSMNLWGFQRSYLIEAEHQFHAFLQGEGDPMTKEFYLPTVADQLICQGKAEVSVLSSQALWYGITYPQDRPLVMTALEKLRNQGDYPEKLWE